MLEREIKLSFDDAGTARTAILAAGAQPLRARRLQDDTLFDSVAETLRNRSCVVRLRRDGDSSVLTFKGPVHPGMMKVREELETVIGDADVLRRVFGELGFRAWFRYQKYREEYAARGVVIAIDETPVGTFVELEGDEAAILSTAAALGRTPDDFILDSYRGLFLKRREQFHIAGPDMLFVAE